MKPKYDAQEAHKQSVEQYSKWLRLVDTIVLEAIAKGEFSVTIKSIETNATIALNTWFTDQGYTVTTEWESQRIGQCPTKETCIISWAEID